MSVSSAAAQEFVPDDRYAGYPKSLVVWPTLPPNMDPTDLMSCPAQEYYEPSDTHLTVYATRVKVAGVRTQEFDECRWMLTRNKWRWVMRPAGTKHLVDARGRDLFDGGSPTGKECDNPSPFGFAIRPRAQVAIEQPAPLPPQVTPPVFLRLPPPAPAMVPPSQPAPLFQPFVPAPEPVRSSGFCGKKCKWTLVAVGGGAVAGYAAWYYWPCIVGARR